MAANVDCRARWIIRGIRLDRGKVENLCARQRVSAVCAARHQQLPVLIQGGSRSKHTRSAQHSCLRETTIPRNKQLSCRYRRSAGTSSRNQYFVVIREQKCAVSAPPHTEIPCGGKAGR